VCIAEHSGGDVRGDIVGIVGIVVDWWSDEGDRCISGVLAVRIVGDVRRKSVSLSDSRIGLSVGTGLLSERAVASEVLLAA
jgi:hypothetical protein